MVRAVPEVDDAIGISVTSVLGSDTFFTSHDEIVESVVSKEFGTTHPHQAAMHTKVVQYHNGAGQEIFVFVSAFLNIAMVV